MLLSFIPSEQYGRRRKESNPSEASQGAFKDYLGRGDAWKTLLNLIFGAVGVGARACGAELRAAASALLACTLVHKALEKVLSKLI